MTLEEFREQLDTAGFPVAYRVFPKDEPHDPPFICYFDYEENTMPADGITYYKAPMIQVELYTLKRSHDAEKTVETALASFYFTKEAGWLDDEQMYMVVYQLSL